MSEDNETEEVQEEAGPDPKKRGLGRGLGALFEDEEGVYPQPGDDGHTPGVKRTMMGLDQMEPGTYQPRHDFSEENISELAESIAKHGVLQPLIVRPKPGFQDIHEIVAGERRWRAAQAAQLHEVPVIIKSLGDEDALEIALIENLQREDLNAIEEARGYQRLMEEFGHTQEVAAKALGKSRSHVANTVRLLTLPRKVADMIRDGRLSAGHARTLIGTDNPEELANIIVSQGLNVREAETLSAEKQGRTSRTRKEKTPKDVDTLALESEISAALGMKVTIDVKGKGAGTFKVDFKSLDQLDEVLHRLSHFPGRQQSG